MVVWKFFRGCRCFGLGLVGIVVFIVEDCGEVYVGCGGVCVCVVCIL